jgi:hypothetical protein
VGADFPELQAGQAEGCLELLAAQSEECPADDWSAEGCRVRQVAPAGDCQQGAWVRYLRSPCASGFLFFASATLYHIPGSFSPAHAAVAASRVVAGRG